jgi:hypothetical protein
VIFCDRSAEYQPLASNDALLPTMAFFSTFSFSVRRLVFLTAYGLLRDGNLQEQWLQKETGNDEKEKRMVLL